MKHLKMLLTAAIAMAAALAFASTALATEATSPQGTPYTGILSGSGTATFHGVVTISCEAALEGSIESHGSSVTGKGEGEKWEYIKCGEITIHTIKKGTIEVHAIGNGEGTITSSGTVGLVTIPSLKIACEYTTNETDLGVVTDSSVTGGKARIDLRATIFRTGGNIFCGTSIELTGEATVNSPETIFID